MTVSIIQISDTHIEADPNARFDGIDCAATLKTVLTHINRHEDPDLILLTGDLVHEPGSDSYRRLNDLLQVAPVPVYVIPGNHDDPALMPQLLTAPVRHEREIRAEHWRILLLDTWLESEHAGRITDAELAWLEESLQEEQHRPVLIGLHHPPVSIDSPWMDAIGLLNTADLLRVLDYYSQIRAVIWGHIHQVYEAQRNHMRLLGCPSTCVQFKPRSLTYARDELGPGYRRLLLQENGEIATEVVRI